MRIIRQDVKTYVAAVINSNKGPINILPMKLQQESRNRQERHVKGLEGRSQLFSNTKNNLMLDNKQLRLEVLSSRRKANPDVIFKHSPEDKSRSCGN